MAKSYSDVKTLLEQHRAEKAAQERREKLKENLRQPWKLLYPEEASSEGEQKEEEEEEVEEVVPNADRLRKYRREPRPVAPPMTPREIYWWRVKLAVKILLWLGIWIFFIYVEFGAVFFIFSCLFFMYANLGRGDKGPSAYSVFNSDYERLQGTFTAEDFDASLRSGMGLVR